MTLVAVLCLMATAILAPLLAAPASAFGDRVFAANPVAGAGDPTYPVYASSTLAQSFEVETTFLIERVTLRVQNDGSSVNPLAVSIHPDDSVRHVPLMSTSLVASSQVTPNNAGGPENWTFPLNPAAKLLAGTTYWIVAENAAPQGPPTNGYAWVESNGDTYPAGSAYLLDPATGIWTGLPYDLYFSTYGLEFASNITAGVSANRTQAQPGDFVTFKVFVNNTGNQTAPTVWVNDTLASRLTTPTLGFPNISPVSAAAFPNLTFRNLTNGPHYFTVGAQIAYGTPPGTLLGNSVSVDFENATGSVARGRSAAASVLVGLATKQLYLGGTSISTKLLTTTPPTLVSLTTSSLNPGAAQPLDFELAPALARPFVALNVTANLWINTQHAPPQTLKLNVSLLDNATVVASLFPTVLVTVAGYHLYTFSFPALNYTFGADDKIRLQIGSLGGGGGSTDTLLLSYNSTANPSRLDLRTTTYVSVGGFELRNAAGPTTTWSPADSLTVWANVSEPFGVSRIAGVWVNITSPSGSLAASSAMGTLATDSSSLPAWRLFGFTLSPPLSTGRYRVDVVAKEDNGVASRAQGFADVAVPSIILENVANVTRARVGTTYAYFLYYNNTGTGPAGSIWINDTLPAEVNFVTSSIVYSSRSGSTFTWALTNVPVGPHAIEVDVTVPGSSISATVIESRATLDYTDTSAHALGTSYSNASVILNGPDIALALASVPAGVVHANQTVTYTVSLDNTGDPAGGVWVNDTLPTGFSYVSDTASTLGGTSVPVGGQVRFYFTSMPAGTTWNFQLLAAAGPALARNGSYVNTASLEYVSATGIQMPRGSTGITNLAAAPWMSQAAIIFPQNRSSPSARVGAVVRFANLGNEPASIAWVNLTLDARLTFVNASSAHTGNGTSIRFLLSQVPLRTSAIFLNLTVNDSTPDQTTLQIIGTLEYRDQVGNAQPSLVLTPGSILVNVAVLSLSVTPYAPTIEAGTAFPLILSIYNWGSGSTGDVWLNVTFPAALTYYDDTSGTVLSQVGSAYSWHWDNQLPGLFQFDLYVRPREATPNGTAADLDFWVAYKDFELRTRPSLMSPVRVVVLAPSLQLNVVPSDESVLAGAQMTYTLRVQNQGATLAEQVRVTDDIDPRLQVLSYDSSVGALGSQKLTWTFTDVAPGAVETINLTVRVADGLQAGTVISMALEANYTNSFGTPLDHIRSIPTAITIDIDLLPFVLIAVGGVVGGILFYTYLARRSKVEIEEVFLVYRDGVLISHLSRTLMREKDEDVLSGMLTAVQEFVREAFQYGEHRELHKLDFGEYRILIERGKYVYLAVVYSGEESPAIRKKVKSVIDRVEDQFGAALEKWDGDMEEVVGARDLIRETLLGSGNHNHNHAAKPSPPEP